MTLLHRRAAHLPSLTWVVVLLAAAVLTSAGCASNRAATPAPTEQPPPVEEWSDVTLGERLGQLDALMRTASPDELPALQEEYRRLLAERVGEPAVAFTGPAGAGGGRDTMPPPPLVAATGEPDRAVLRPQDDRPLKGFRPSELNPGRRASAARKTERTDRNRTSVTRRPPAATRPRAAAAPRTAPGERAATSVNDRGVRQQLVTGIAAARSGNYEHAVRNLAPVVATGKGGPEARYYYATALERTGDLAAARQEYLRASRSGDALGDRAFLGYCRVLAATGERDRARELVQQFLRENPASPVAVQARRMLQTL